MKEFIEKLIARLEKQKKFHFERESPFMEYRILTFNEIISIVNELAEEHKIVDLCNQICDKADEILQKGNGGWIPCSERLPEDDCWAITCDNEGNIHIFFYSSGYFHESFGGKAITEHNERFYVPIAWQPLPEPYQPPAAEKNT